MHDRTKVISNTLSSSDSRTDFFKIRFKTYNVEIKMYIAVTLLYAYTIHVQVCIYKNLLELIKACIQME